MIFCECGCGQTPKWKGSKFCQGHHLKKGAKNPITRPKKNINTCRICGCSFYRRGKISSLCSQKCAGKAYSIRFKSITSKCVNCGIELIIPNNKKFQGIKHCSKKCRLISLEKDAENGIGSWSKIRDFTYRKRGYICEECGYKSHPELLVVHHIDGKHDFNNLPSNLKILCPTCHGEHHLILNPNRKKRVPSYR